MKNTLDLFVSKNLSKLLCEKGLSRNSDFQYHCYPDREQIVSHRFDYMGLYGLDILVSGVKTEYETIPAYTLSEMLNLIPEWGMAKVGDKYEVSTGSIYPEVHNQWASNYADAAAKVVLEMIRQRVVPIEQLNQNFIYHKI